MKPFYKGHICQRTSINTYEAHRSEETGPDQSPGSLPRKSDAVSFVEELKRLNGLGRCVVGHVVTYRQPHGGHVAHSSELSDFLNTNLDKLL